MGRFLFPILFSLLLAGCGQGVSSGKIPTGDPSKPTVTKLRGHKYHFDAMIKGRNEFVWAQQVFSGYRGVYDKAVPEKIATLDETCKFPVPDEQDEVHHVHVATSRLRAPVYAVSADDIGDRAARYVSSYVASEGKPKGNFTGGDGLGIVNVAVTQTEAPVYLVLTSQTRTIWNIHAADNVTISHIALISRSNVGIANVPAGTSVSAAGKYHFKKCGVEPSRRPRDHWRFVQNVKKHGSGDDLLQKDREAGNAYRRWFGKTFKRSSTQNFYEGNAISNVLIGEVPATEENRITYKSLKKASLLVTREDYLFPATVKDYKKRNLAIVRATAEEAAGGDLGLLLAGVSQ